MIKIIEEKVLGVNMEEHTLQSMEILELEKPFTVVILTILEDGHG